MRKFTTEQRNKIHREVDTNYDFFLEYLKNHKKVQQEHKGEYALIRHQEIIGFFQDDYEAIKWGQEQYPDHMFSIQDVDNKPYKIGYGLA